MIEKWRSVIGFEDYYDISNIGRVYSIRSNMILKQRLDQKGYPRVMLSVKGNRKNAKIHRLVAEAFIQKPENLNQVNHINEIKTDNRVDNLEWCDIAYNNSHGTAHKCRGEKIRKKVAQCDLNGNIIKIWNSITELNENGFNKGCVSACCNNKPHYNTHKGYTWKFINSES